MISRIFFTPALAAILLAFTASEAFSGLSMLDSLTASLGPVSPPNCTISDPLSEVYIKVAPNADGADCSTLDDSKFKSVIECKDSKCTVSDYDIPPLDAKSCLKEAVIGSNITSSSIGLSVTKVDAGAGASLLTSLIALPIGLKLDATCGSTAADNKVTFGGYTGDQNTIQLLSGLVPASALDGVVSGLGSSFAICQSGSNSTVSFPPSASETDKLKADAADSEKKDDDKKKDSSSGSGMMGMLGPMLGDLGSTLDGTKITLAANIEANGKNAMACEAVLSLKKK